MRIKITSDGRVLEGTAKQIVEAMHYVAFGQEQRTLSEYIDWAVDQASRMNELDLKVEGETDEAIFFSSSAAWMAAASIPRVELASKVTSAHLPQTGW